MEKKIKPVKYEIEIDFLPEERAILDGALRILKEANKILDNSFETNETECVYFTKESEDLLQELDKYTDYIAKR